MARPKRNSIKTRTLAESAARWWTEYLREPNVLQLNKAELCAFEFCLVDRIIANLQNDRKANFLPIDAKIDGRLPPLIFDALKESGIKVDSNTILFPDAPTMTIWKSGIILVRSGYGRTLACVPLNKSPASTPSGLT